MSPSESATHEYDAFISYSHRDRAWVADVLLPRLEAAGARVCVDFRDFTPGKAVLHNIRDAVTRSRHTIVVVTSSWIGSEWANYETLLSRSADPTGMKARTIPLLRDNCAIPEDLAFLTCVDFSLAGREDLAWRQLFAAIEAQSEGLPAVRGDWLLAHPYAMPPNFTGRATERAMLTGWLSNATAHPMLVMRALGGFGKSALTWQWLLHDVSAAQWPRVIWWSFYENDASFDSFLIRSVAALTDRHAQDDTPRERLDRLIATLRTPGTLLVFDGVERLLQAFAGLGGPYRDDGGALGDSRDRECVSPLADAFLRAAATLPDIRAKLLLTTRLRPSALETRDGLLLKGCREVELRQLERNDALAFLRAQGIRGPTTDAEAVCEAYGCHPLSLRLLAGLIGADFEQPGDIEVARRLDVSGDLVQRQHHVLQQAFDSLLRSRNDLLARLSCFRGPVSYDVLKTLAEADASGALSSVEPIADLQVDLRDLISRGLVFHDSKTKQFDLHPIVRRYAYHRFSQAERRRAHERLGNFFAAIPSPASVHRLDDLAPVIELFHHTARAGRYEEAYSLFRDRLNIETYDQFGAHQLRIELLGALFPDGEDRPPRLVHRSHQGWTLNSLANSYSLSGQLQRALPLYERQLVIYDAANDKRNIAVTLGNIASCRLQVGQLRMAESDLARSITMSREIRNEMEEAVSHHEIGLLHAYRGDWPMSSSALAEAQEILVRQNDQRARVLTWPFAAMHAVLRLRCDVAAAGSSALSLDYQTTIDSARRALEAAETIVRDDSRMLVSAHLVLGSAYRLARNLDEASHHLHEALERCRAIAMVWHEAAILTELAHVALLTGGTAASQTLAGEALAIAERAGSVMQSADAHLVLARLASRRGDEQSFRDHGAAGLRLAACDGPPDYSYKAAHVEATRLITTSGSAGSFA